MQYHLFYCCVGFRQSNMDLIFLKIVLLVNGWLFARGSPVAMLQHATSSQSIVFHQTQPTAQSIAASGSDRLNSAPAKYEYKYEVSDHQTGDRKSHWESRDGDRVRGVYTLYEPDGALRTVEYTADALHGFNAVVRRNEPTKHQHPLSRPTESPYNQVLSSNSVHDHERYDSGRPGFSERSPYTSGSDRYNKDTSRDGIGFSVNHDVGWSKTGDRSVAPY